MATDRFGNLFAPDVPYARGRHLTATGDDIAKLKIAWGHVQRRIGDATGAFNFSGLERRLPYVTEDLALMDDELAPALFGAELTALGLDHMGGIAPRDDVAVMNRLTAAVVAATLVLVGPGDVVIGVSPSHSHPCLTRAAKRAGATFVEAVGLAGFEAALAAHPRPRLVALTRLAVTYDILAAEEIQRIVARAHGVGARVLLDDAGGARVGPAIFDQPKSLGLGVDVAATGLDKYGVVGPRLGLLAGRREIVAAARTLAVELGLEARPMLYPAVVHSLRGYRQERVRELVATTKLVAAALRARLGNRLAETPVTAKLYGEDILELALERAGLRERPIVPYEATAALAMLLLRDHGIMTVHFAGLPPGTSTLLIKFVPPETLARFGGAERFAAAVDAAIDALARLMGDGAALHALLLGAPAAVAAA
ncbi:MAG: hypothetical protein EXQ96_05870 [Alphaproteobacteria bacterium]|nr:hypothetical protein [Alphaproteobacteria bacterium]